VLVELGLVEQRYQAVLEVIGHAASVTEVAARFGVPVFDRMAASQFQSFQAMQTDTNVKAMLLNASEPERWKTPLDTRPLIDQLHEATFTNPVGLQWIKDKYGLRTLLRKAHCFTLDAETSALVADFSIAIGSDLESARRMAIPPFPVTWIDVDNRARLGRVKERGVGLTPTAAGETDAGPPVACPPPS